MSAVKVHAGAFNVPNNSALAPYLRVKKSSGNLAAADAGDPEIGLLAGRTFADSSVGSVQPLESGYIYQVVAAGAITSGADVFPAAGGKIDDTSNGKRWGVAQEAASGDGSIIRVQYLPDNGEGRVTDHTADATLTDDQVRGDTHTSVGATGTVTLTLPAAKKGMEVFARVGAAQELRLDPNGTETVALPSTGVQGAAGKYLTANADGETVHLRCDKDGQWSSYGYAGTWTAEA